jgi:hypothetical protein
MTGWNYVGGRVDLLGGCHQWDRDTKKNVTILRRVSTVEFQMAILHLQLNDNVYGT